jgi:hypothetical protein
MRRAMSRAFTEVIALESAGNGDRGYECPQGATSIPPHRHLLVVAIGPTGLIPQAGAHPIFCPVAKAMSFGNPLTEDRL